MNKLHTAFAAFIFCGSAFAGAADLTIEVTDVQSADGTVKVALYTADSFLKKPAAVKSAQAAAGSVKLVMTDVPEGSYAFALYHDANGNGKLDRNAMGIPTEDYSFSNGAMGTMGPPSFDSARFVVPAAGATARVSLK